MDRMRHRVVIVAAVAAVLVVVAAASGPVRIWTTPTVEVGLSPVDTNETSGTFAPPVTVLDETSGDPRWSGALLQIVGVLIIVAAVLALPSIVRSLRPHWRRRFRGSVHSDIDALPEPEENELTVDVDAARAALAAGEARNAIVACWMQLERDAAAAGLARSEAETSAEYAERVVVLSSVDPAPIGELAALYREARFSRHDLTDDHRSRAFAALDRVAAALRRGVTVAT